MTILPWDLRIPLRVEDVHLRQAAPALSLSDHEIRLSATDLLIRTLTRWQRSELHFSPDIDLPVLGWDVLSRHLRTAIVPDLEVILTGLTPGP